MKCPHCDETLKLRESVYLNVEAYRKAQIAATLCCGKPISVNAVVTIQVFKSETTSKQDDWGIPFKK